MTTLTLIIGTGYSLTIYDTWSICKAVCGSLCAFAKLQVPLGQGSQTQSDRVPHETQRKVSRAALKKMKKIPSNFYLKTKNSWKNMQIVYKFWRNSRIFRCLRAALDPLGGRMFETAALGQTCVDTSESRVKWSRRDVQSDGLLLSSDNRFNQYKCFRERVIYYSIW